MSCTLRANIFSNGLNGMKHNLAVLLLALSAGWPAKLNNVEIYKCSQEVQESGCRHQDRKQVG